MGKAEKFIILERELSRYITAMHEAAEIILNEGVSNYPIFVAHQQEVSIGLPIIEKEKVGGLWNIHASTLEEFVVKNIIHKDKVDEFRANYKSPEDHLCVFVLSELGAKFVYIKVKG